MPIERGNYVYIRPSGEYDWPVNVKQDLRDYLARIPEIVKAYLICVTRKTGEPPYINLAIESAGGSGIDPPPNVDFKKINDDNEPWIDGVFFVNNLDGFFGGPDGRARFVAEPELIFERCQDNI